MTASAQVITAGGLIMPDLRPHFKHLHWRAMPHSMGIEVASDWADKPADDPVFGLYKKCGLWTMDEAAILYNCAARAWGTWLDIGMHTGWTTAHVAESADVVIAIDPMRRVDEFAARGNENLREYVNVASSFDTSDEFFAHREKPGSWVAFSGVCIDGDHDRPCPMNDARNSAKHLADTGVILLHDAWGAPVFEAAIWLMDNGFKARFYDTVHGVICCWRGDFVPPNFNPLFGINWVQKRAASKFPFGRCV